MSQLVPVSATCFQHEARNILRDGSTPGTSTANRRFRAMFGATPRLCSLIWKYLLRKAPPQSKPKHLLWALLFLKVYNSEHVNRTMTGGDEKTYRKWVWIFVELMSELRLIRWSSRLRGRENSVYKAFVDGVDFMIREPKPFSPIWYSHKFKGPGLRYEVGVGIESGNMCWAYGPFPCGAFSDLKIYRLAMKGRLMAGETVVADGGYRDETCTYGTTEYEDGHWSFVRARHEAVNKRLKQFLVLGNRFRHALHRHSACFHAVANITFLLIEQGEPVFEEEHITP